jgi:hypothetical protein
MEEALALTHESEAASMAGDVDAQLGWRRVRSKILASRGDLAEGLRLANEAVELARRTDYLDMWGEVCMDRAEVLRLAGQGDEAMLMLKEAIEMFELKGNVVMAAQARALLA